MDDIQWTEIAALIDAWWPATDFGEDSEAAYFLELERFDRDDVEAAVRMQLMKGGTWAPSLAALLVELEVKTDELPSFRQAWNRILWALRRSGTEESTIGLLATEHAVIADFVATYGYDELRLENLDHGATMHRIEQTWNDHVERWARRQQHAGVERSQIAASRRRQGQLEKPAFASELES